ncbi:histidine-containing phosphotransfer protein 1-like isoform X1 [Curcuma longa]|uniref:histidine-containing phosphotransfer protein 1-like isoform X1 n=1 Tax=Curcuma longa TaxID=136217 RepID=UPI003D9E1B62
MTPAEELDSLIHWMFSEGLLDQQFQQLQMLQDASNPNFVAEVITLFCKDSEIILTELTKLLNQPVVDFEKVDAYVHQLKGSSSSVGANNVKLACIHYENNKGCLSALNVVESEYFRLKDKLAAMFLSRQSKPTRATNKFKE